MRSFTLSFCTAMILSSNAFAQSDKDIPSKEGAPKQVTPVEKKKELPAEITKVLKRGFRRFTAHSTPLDKVLHDIQEMSKRFDPQKVGISTQVKKEHSTEKLPSLTFEMGNMSFLQLLNAGSLQSGYGWKLIQGKIIFHKEFPLPSRTLQEASPIGFAIAKEMLDRKISEIHVDTNESLWSFLDTSAFIINSNDPNLQSINILNLVKKRLSLPAYNFKNKSFREILNTVCEQNQLAWENDNGIIVIREKPMLPKEIKDLLKLEIPRVSMDELTLVEIIHELKELIRKTDPKSRGMSFIYRKPLEKTEAISPTDPFAGDGDPFAEGNDPFAERANNEPRFTIEMEKVKVKTLFDMISIISNVGWKATPYAIVFSAEFPMPGENAPKDPKAIARTEKILKIKMAKFEAKKISLEQLVVLIKAKSRTIDTKKKGFNLTLHMMPSTKSLRFDLDEKNISLQELLNQLQKDKKLTWKNDNGTIIIHHVVAEKDGK